jgi:hypothetical protein
MFCLFLALWMHHVSWTHIHISNIGYKILLTNSKEKKNKWTRKEKQKSPLLFPWWRSSWVSCWATGCYHQALVVDRQPVWTLESQSPIFRFNLLNPSSQTGRRPAAGGRRVRGVYWGREDSRARSAARRRSYQRSEGGLGVVVACSSSQRR